MHHAVITSYALALALLAPGSLVLAQGSSEVTLDRARIAARSASWDVAAARATFDAARGRARQAGAFPNPVVSYAREQTAAGGLETSQRVIAVDQSLDAFGVRGARRAAARLRAAAAEARLRAAESHADFDAARALAHAIAADRRATLADQAARAFAAAVTTSERRLAAGDISGFAVRRIRLEAARYTVLRAEAQLARSAARSALAALTALPIDSMTQLVIPTPDPMMRARDVASLAAAAQSDRADLRAAIAEFDAAREETRLASRERVPGIGLTLGSKGEETTAGERLSGLVAGISIPIPLWDRRAGSVTAASGEERRRESEVAALRRRVAREVAEADAALRSAHEALGAFGPALESDAEAALRSGQVAYNEGDLSLLEWLDTVRAFYETMTSIAGLRAEVIIRSAALERAAGTNMTPEPR
jgi:cobalt-zinc-cadmium efflux system outer membrane protein